MKKKNNRKINKEPSTFYDTVKRPDSIDMVNRYGTYEIQYTADTENQYPAIAQGFNEKIIETDCDNPQ